VDECKHTKNGECTKMESLEKENKTQWDHINGKLSLKYFTIYVALILAIFVALTSLQTWQTRNVSAQVVSAQKEILDEVKTQTEKQEIKLDEVKDEMQTIAVAQAGHQGKITERLKTVSEGLCQLEQQVEKLRR